MKIAIVSAPTDQVLIDKPGWVFQGFQDAGYQVRRCHTIEEAKRADRKCDIVLCDHKDSGINANSLADIAFERSARFVQWYRDLVAFDPLLLLSEQPYVQSFRRLMRQMDVVLVKERSLLKEYRELGIRARWFDQACPANMPACKHSKGPQWDVLVLGAATYEQRRKDARALAEAGFRVLWAGLPSGTVPPGIEQTHWRHPVNELPALASECAVVLGVDWRSDLPGYTSDRTYLATGMGACYVHRASPGFPEIPSFSYQDTDQLIATVRELVGNYDLRRETGEAARNCVMRHHTYRNRAQSLVELVRDAA